MANEYKVIAIRRYKGFKVEFRVPFTGGIYASVNDKWGMYVTDGEWPAPVAEYVLGKIETYCITGIIQ